MLPGPEKLGFAVTPGASDDSNSYLAHLVERSRIDGGVTLPLLGSASLAEARQFVNTTVSNLTKLAREALAAGNRASAEQIISEAFATIRTMRRRCRSRGRWRNSSLAERLSWRRVVHRRGCRPRKRPPRRQHQRRRLPRRRRLESGRPQSGRTAAGRNGGRFPARSADHGPNDSGRSAELD